MLRKTVIALMLLGMASPAVADEPDADALTKQGLELRREHRDAEALETFRHAYALAPTPRAQAQIALAEQALGRWIDAESDLHAALLHVDDAWIARHLAVLEEARVSIESRLGWLEVLVDEVGAELWVNGEDRGALPLPAPIRVEAGSLIVDVRASGYTSARRMSAVEPGGTAREVVHLESLSPPPNTSAPALVSPRAPPGAAPSLPRSREVISRSNAPLRNAGFVVLGAGIAEIALGTYFGIRTLNTKSERDGHCTSASCDSVGVALDNDARALALRSTAWFAAGIVSVLGGVALVGFSRAGHARHVDVVVNAGPDHAGVGLGGLF